MLKNFLFVVFISFGVNAFASSKSVLDSTGIEKRGGKTYVVHKVEPKETLYSLSKKYGVSVDDIKKANEGMGDLKAGQVLYIPSKAVAATTQTTKPAGSNPKTHTLQQGETLYALSKKYEVTVEDLKKANPGVNVSEMKTGDVINIPSKGATTTNSVTAPTPLPKTHTVQAKETLYSISKKYGITVDDIKNANPGIGELQPGQVINISSKGSPVTTTTTNPVVENKVEPVQKPVEKPTEKTTDKKTSPIKQPVTTTKPENNLPEIKKDGYTKVNENGFVEPYDAGTDFHYALHKTAPVGTIIYLENPENGQKVFVRVMGKLTDGGSGVIMKISKIAYEKISKGDAKVKVNSSYIP